MGSGVCMQGSVRDQTEGLLGCVVTPKPKKTQNSLLNWLKTI